MTRVLQKEVHNPSADMICAAFSGVVAALTITSQVEHLITSSHVHNQSVMNTFSKIYHQNPVKLILPPGMLAMVGREVPFSTALFYFRPLIAEKFGIHRPPPTSLFPLLIHVSGPLDHATIPWYRQFCYDLQYGFMTSLIATPLSHPASVVASYQQGHDQPILQSIRSISNQYGWKGFFNGLTARTLSLTGTFTVVPIVLRIFSSSSLVNDERI